MPDNKLSLHDPNETELHGLVREMYAAGWTDDKVDAYIKQYREAHTPGTWEKLNTPLVDLRGNSTVREATDQFAKDHPLRDPVTRMSWSAGANNLVDSVSAQSTPLNVGLGVSGTASGIAAKFGRPDLAKALNIPSRVATTAQAVEGAANMASADNMPDFLAGATEAGMGAHGAGITRPAARTIGAATENTANAMKMPLRMGAVYRMFAGHPLTAGAAMMAPPLVEKIGSSIRKWGEAEPGFRPAPTKEQLKTGKLADRNTVTRFDDEINAGGDHAKADMVADNASMKEGARQAKIRIGLDNDFSDAMSNRNGTFYDEQQAAKAAMEKERLATEAQTEKQRINAENLAEIDRRTEGMKPKESISQTIKADTPEGSRTLRTTYSPDETAGATPNGEAPLITPQERAKMKANNYTDDQINRLEQQLRAGNSHPVTAPETPIARAQSGRPVVNAVMPDAAGATRPPIQVDPASAAEVARPVVRVAPPNPPTTPPPSLGTRMLGIDMDLAPDSKVSPKDVLAKIDVIQGELRGHHGSIQTPDDLAAVKKFQSDLNTLRGRAERLDAANTPKPEKVAKPAKPAAEAKPTTTEPVPDAPVTAAPSDTAEVPITDAPVPGSRSKRSQSEIPGLSTGDLGAMRMFIAQNPNATEAEILQHMMAERATRQNSYRVNAGLDKGAQMSADLDTTE